MSWLISVYWTHGEHADVEQLHYASKEAAKEAVDLLEMAMRSKGTPLSAYTHPSQTELRLEHDGGVFWVPARLIVAFHLVDVTAMARRSVQVIPISVGDDAPDTSLN